MIPLCDLVPSRTRPDAALSIIAVSAIAASAAGLSGELVVPARFGASPITWSTSGLLASLVLAPNLVVALANGLALWLFGATLNDRLGHGRFVGLWALSGLAGSLAQAFVIPGSTAWLLGGSAAAAGVVAGALVLHPRGRILGVMPVIIGLEFVDLPSWLYACAWGSILLVATTSTPFSGLAAAVATGAAAGAAGLTVLRRPERLGVEWWDTTSGAR